MSTSLPRASKISPTCAAWSASADPAGRRYVAPGLLSTLFDPKIEIPRQPRYDLTYREREVLVEVVSGRSNNEIGERLLIGTQTVKTHLNNISDKLGVRRRTHAAQLALSQGLV